MVDSMCLTRPAHKVCKGLKRARPILRVFAALSTPWLRAKTAPMISLNISVSYRKSIHLGPLAIYHHLSSFITEYGSTGNTGTKQNPSTMRRQGGKVNLTETWKAPLWQLARVATCAAQKDFLRKALQNNGCLALSSCKHWNRFQGFHHLRWSSRNIFDAVRICDTMNRMSGLASIALITSVNSRHFRHFPSPHHLHKLLEVDLAIAIGVHHFHQILSRLRVGVSKLQARPLLSHIPVGSRTCRNSVEFSLLDCQKANWSPWMCLL